MKDLLKCLTCRCQTAWRYATIIQESERLRTQNAKLKRQVSEAIDIMKNDEEIDWYSKDDEGKLRDLFPDDGDYYVN